MDSGCEVFESRTLNCCRSMLDNDPSENEEQPSEIESGGVSAPELDVQVLDLERLARVGRVKTGTGTTV